MKKESVYIPLYTDIMFKNFFGTTKYIEMTTYLLETLLNLKPNTLKGSTILNSVTLNKEIAKNKSYELDVLLKSPDGSYYNLEMQQIYDENSEIKNVMYIAKLFSEELKVGQTYKDIRPVTLVNFVRNIRMHQTGEIINKYVMTNTKHSRDRILEEYFTIYIINVEKEEKIPYNELKEFNYIRRLIGAKTLEEAEKLVRRSGSLLLKKLLNEMVRFMNEEYVQDLSRQEMFFRSREESYYESGKADGIKEGEVNKQLEIAKNFIRNTNISLEEISLCTNLTLEELRRFQEEIYK